MSDRPTPETDALMLDTSKAAAAGITCPPIWDPVRTLERQRDEAREILAATLKALPVGYLPNHTPESIPERVADLVARYAEAWVALEKVEERYINGHDTYADHEFMGETAQQALARIDAKGGNHE